MKNYYKILEVDENTTQVEIKKSYRSLAKKYHPDKSSSPSAAQLFNEVNEAYEVLSDSTKKLQYDQRRDNTSYQNYQPQRPATHRRRPRPRPPYASDKELDVTPYLPYFRKVSYAAFVVSVFLSLDFLLPRSINQETIQEIKTTMGQARNGRRYVAAIQINTNAGNFKVDPIEFGEQNPFVRGNDVFIHRSQLLKLTTLVTLSKVLPSTEFTKKASIYANFSFSLIIMLITSSIGSFLKKPPMTILNLGIVNGILILLVLYFTSVS